MSNYKQRLAWQLKDKELHSKYWLTGDDVKSSRELNLFRSVIEATQQNFHTISWCEHKGQPVTEEELANISHYALWKSCYVDVMIIDKQGQRGQPYVPVFYRMF